MSRIRCPGLVVQDHEFRVGVLDLDVSSVSMIISIIILIIIIF